MYSQQYPQFDLSSVSYDSMTELSKANMTAFNRLSVLQWGLLTLNVDTSVEQLKLLAEPQNYNDFFSAESNLVDQYQTKATALGQEWVETLTATQQALQALANTETTVESSAAVKQPTKAKRKTTKRKTARKAA